MAIRIQTDERRARYGRFTGTPTPDDLARHFHLHTADLISERSYRELLQQNQVRPDEACGYSRPPWRMLAGGF